MLEAQFEQAVLGVVALTTIRANEIAAPGGSLAVVVCGDSKRYPTAAGDQMHF
jgi:hypothetical protein